MTLLGAVVVLLFVLCANIANLLLVSLASRRRELSVRAALGATPWRITAQLLGEVAVLVTAGGVGGLFVGRGLARVLVWWGGSALPRLDDIGLTPRVAAFALAVTVIAALLCGVMPAWLFSEAPIVGLAEEGRTSSGSVAQGRFRRGFAAMQVAAALMLLVAMLLTVRSFRRLEAVNPGFDGRDVLSVQLALPPARYAAPTPIVTFAQKLRRDLTEMSGVRDAAAISLLPLSGLLSTQDYRVVGRAEPAPDEVPQAHYRIVTPGYFHIMGVGLHGREFNDDDREATRRVAVISRTLADRDWPGAWPIGEHIIVGGDTLEVIGVCDDVKQFGLDAGRTADLYVPLRQMPANQAQFVAARMYWVVRTIGEPMQAADAVRAAVRRLDKDVATSSTRSVSQMLAASVGSRRFNTDLIEIAGMASLLLAIVGVYSVTAFSMTRRTREIGIRLAFGARPSQIIGPVLAPEWSAIALGLAVGSAAAAIIPRVMGTVLFATSGLEPSVIVGAATMLGCAALAATLVLVRRAIQTDPVKALRME